MVLNTAPVADAGPDQAAHTGERVTLAAEGTDADGDPLTFQWTQTAGPPVALAGADTPVASFVAPAAGLYSFSVFVEDGFTESPADEKSVTVSDFPPEMAATLREAPRRPTWVEPSHEDGLGGGGGASGGCGCGGGAPALGWLVGGLAALTLARKRR